MKKSTVDILFILGNIKIRVTPSMPGFHRILIYMVSRDLGLVLLEVAYYLKQRKD